MPKSKPIIPMVYNKNRIFLILLSNDSYFFFFGLTIFINVNAIGLGF